MQKFDVTSLLNQFEMFYEWKGLRRRVIHGSRYWDNECKVIVAGRHAGLTTTLALCLLQRITKAPDQNILVLGNGIRSVKFLRCFDRQLYDFMEKSRDEQMDLTNGVSVKYYSTSQILSQIRGRGGANLSMYDCVIGDIAICGTNIRDIHEIFQDEGFKKIPTKIFGCNDLDHLVRQPFISDFKKLELALHRTIERYKQKNQDKYDIHFDASLANT
jgi:hypothetical protein